MMQAHPVNSSSGVTIHSDGIMAFVVATVGAGLAGLAMLCLVIAVSAVFVVAAWREADMSELSRLRGQVNKADAYMVINRDKITKLEAKNVSEANQK